MALNMVRLSFLQKIMAEAFFRGRHVPAQHYAIDVEENRKLKLYNAAINGDWEIALEIFTGHSHEITPITIMNQLGETPLHIATAASRTEFVQHLLDLIDVEDLTLQTNRGDTAFFYAVVCGYIEIATIMLHKNPALATIRGGEDMLPIRAAALRGHELLVRLLYKDAKDRSSYDDDCGIDLLITFINCYLYDIAIQMISEKPSLATEASNSGETALSAFARTPAITSEKFTNKFSEDYLWPDRRNKLRTQGFKLLRLILQQMIMSSVNAGEGNSVLIKEALFIAAKQGNWEFLTTLLHSDPGLAIEVDENCYTIFHYAVLYRHAKIFNIISEIDSTENTIKLMKDMQGNNILHLTAKLPLSTRLEVVPGAALQLHRELLWFEKVKKMVGSHEMEEKNGEGKTPTELFIAEHKELRERGEKWMKDTTNSCMVVATLVAGVAFASSVTLPGGTEENTGIPNLAHDTWFKLFSVANAVSLIFSASAILFFLTVFTSHYSMIDFKRSLPIKFILGLLLLSGAVQAMIVSFAATFSITFRHQLVIANFIRTLAAIPLFYFFLVQFPLNFSTYISILTDWILNYPTIG